MQCNCGGETAERTVQKDYKIVVEYRSCTSCGRVLITKDIREGDDGASAAD